MAQKLPSAEQGPFALAAQQSRLADAAWLCEVMCCNIRAVASGQHEKKPSLEGHM